MESSDSETAEGAWAQAFGRRVAELRQAKGWKQTDLAERIGVSRSAMVSMENGQFGPQGAGIRIVRRIATELGTSMSALCGEESVVPGLVMVDLSVVRQLEVVRDKLDDDEADLARSLWESLLTDESVVWAVEVPRAYRIVAPDSDDLSELRAQVDPLVADVKKRLGTKAKKRTPKKGGRTS